MLRYIAPQRKQVYHRAAQAIWLILPTTLKTHIFVDHDSKVYKFVKNSRHIFQIVQSTRSIYCLTMMWCNVPRLLSQYGIRTH